MPKKSDTSKKTGGRKTGTAKTGKAAPRAAGTPKKGPAPPEARSGGAGPFYALVILGLGVLVVIMANRLYFSGPKKTAPAGQKKPVTAVGQSDRKDPSRVKEGAGKEKENAHEGKQQSILVPERTVRIYLVHLDEKTERISLLPVSRKIRSEIPLMGALEALVRGPSAAEKKKGMLTAVPGDLRIHGITVKNGIAHIDFNGAVEKNATGTIIISRIDQIVYTATQFPEVKGVVLKINGKTRTVIGSDGLSLSTPLTRKWH